MPNASILVADDEKSIRLTVAQALSSQGYEVATAIDGSTALEQLKETPTDLLLLDIQMPGMTGIEVLQKAITQQPSLKVVMVSAHGSVDNAVEAMKLGAVDYLQKPFTPSELRELVNRVLERETNDSGDCDAEVANARKLAGEGKYEEAIAAAKQCIGNHPQDAAGFNLLGELLEAGGDRSEALKNYRVALDLDPTYKAASNNLDRAATNPTSKPSF
ncbi:response regulator receiver domain protein [Synechococcus sp. PCC 7335]|uniref:sigma-54-dependent transcriptional regulator n=1 Tax=Synechococcus sp. (strain ATCC 29403 / PCC 7335) TaxID=91464 RepID=UPI00017ED8E6|nr:response regulator [Synechococcus sp. PCC 7335]EDX87394.1 response regulator receiver domain protein [Synechococcus sp. PCC 7335]